MKRYILHKKCYGTITIFTPKTYGLCNECGTEGYFEIYDEDGFDTLVEFTKITVVRGKDENYPD